MFSECSAKLVSALEMYAQSLRDGVVQPATNDLQLFAMYVIPLEVCLRLTKLETHEALREEGALLEYDASQGNAMFVSHQWTGKDHPDESFEQFAVFQKALKGWMSGESSISANISMELYRGDQSTISTREFFSGPLYIWYDYFCCPQTSGAGHARQLAINSIPSYVDRCQFFVILCPHVRRQEGSTLLNRRTWGSRGWCRLERMARELSTHADTCVSVEIHGPAHQVEAHQSGWMTAAVGQGHFTVEEDRRLVGSAIQKMVQRKMLSYLARVDLDSFRMMFNLQRVHFRNLPVKPVDDVVPGFISNSQDPAAAAVASFFYQNGFHSISQRNSGFSPMCFAALDGRPLLLAALLEQRADVNDRVSGEAGPPFANCPLLHVCSYLSHNEAIRFLINHGADVKAKDGYGATALPWAAFSDNVEGIRVLIAAGCDPKEADMLGYVPFILASSAGSLASMKELLPYTPRQAIDNALNAAMLQGGASAEVVSLLVSLDADVNHSSAVPPFSALGIWFTCLSVRHRFNETKLTAYAYHHEGLTPLMCSVLTSSFEATAILLGVGARTDLRNSRGKTASDLAIETSAPDDILQALLGVGDARERLVRNVAEFVQDLATVSESF